MIKTSPEHQIKLSNDTIKEMLQSYNLQLKSFKVPKRGIENTTLLLNTNQGKFVLRVYRKDNKKPKDILQELDFMNYLAKHHLPVPCVYANTKNQLINAYKKDGVLWQYILMEFMDGSEIKKYTPRLIKNLASIQGMMHILGQKFAKRQVRRKRFPTTLTESFFLPNINLDEIKKPEIKEFLLSVKKFKLRLSSSLPMGFNHLDYDYGNTLFKNGKLSAILDFEDISYSPIVLCLGYSMWGVLFINNKVDMLKYLDAYSKIRSLSKKELGLLKDVLLFRNYIIGAMHVRFLGENNSKVKRIIKLEKIIKALEF